MLEIDLAYNFIFLFPDFLLNVGNSIKCEKNITPPEYFKNSLQNSNNIPSKSKTIQHTPIHAKFRENVSAFSSYSAKTNRDGWTDEQTEGRGALQYLPSQAFGAAGDNKRITYKHTDTHICNTQFPREHMQYKTSRDYYGSHIKN